LIAITDRKHYEVEEARQGRQVTVAPDLEVQEMLKIFLQYGITEEYIFPIAEKLKRNPSDWIKVKIQFGQFKTPSSFV
jgi:hypothetical protein